MNESGENCSVPCTTSSLSPSSSVQSAPPTTTTTNASSSNNNIVNTNRSINTGNQNSIIGSSNSTGGLFQHRKFPGLAKQSNVDGKDKLLQSTSEFLNKSAASSNAITTNNNNNHGAMSSFQQFSASCEDAWDSKIEDKISFENERNNPYVNTRQKFGSRYGNIHIKEKATEYQESHPQESSRPVLKATSNLCSTTVASTDQSTRSLLSASVGTNSNDPRITKLKKLLYEDEVTNMNELRKLAWNGVPCEDRPLAWKLLLGHVPPQKSKRESVLQKRVQEYKNLVVQYYHSKADGDDIYRQIHIDIPRMQPLLSLFQQPIVQGIFERVLYIWSIRHPASGYVQGMNDLVTPFFVTFLSEHVPGHTFADVEAFDVSTLSQPILDGIESDSYWSFNKLLDSIQDNYTFAQPGIQKLVHWLANVVSRVDKELHLHLTQNTVEYLQFAFRWMNNLLIREIPLRCIIRLWDTYLSEGAVNTSYVPMSSSNFNTDTTHELNTWSMNSGTPFASSFHLFVCAAFLRFWTKDLLEEKDFQGLMLRLQNLPTYHWTEKEVKLLVADAYTLKYHFSPNHLNSN